MRKTQGKAPRDTRGGQKEAEGQSIAPVLSPAVPAVCLSPCLACGDSRVALAVTSPQPRLCPVPRMPLGKGFSPEGKGDKGCLPFPCTSKPRVWVYQQVLPGVGLLPEEGTGSALPHSGTWPKSGHWAALPAFLCPQVSLSLAWELLP